MNLTQFINNRANFPAEKLAKYAGQYVGWSADGTQILASDPDEIRLDAALISAGYDASEVLVSFVPAADEVVLGGGEVSE